MDSSSKNVEENIFYENIVFEVSNATATARKECWWASASVAVDWRKLGYEVTDVSRTRYRLEFFILLERNIRDCNNCLALQGYQRVPRRTKVLFKNLNKKQWPRFSFCHTPYHRVTLLPIENEKFLREKIFFWGKFNLSCTHFTLYHFLTDRQKYKTSNIKYISITMEAVLETELFFETLPIFNNESFLPLPGIFHIKNFNRLTNFNGWNL